MIFNGAGGDQAIGGSQRTNFGDLSIAGGATVVVPAANPPTVAGAVTNNGTLKQTQMVKNAAVQFLHLTDREGSRDKYLGVEITTSNDLGSTSVAVTGGQIYAQTPHGGLPVRRCYTVTPAAPAAATVRFYFRQSDLRAGQTVENLNVWRYDGATWQAVTRAGNANACVAGAIDCWVSGTTAVYSPFVLKIHSPLAVQLAALTATSSPQGVTLAWETVSEMANAGFNVYRAEGPVDPTGVLRKDRPQQAWIKLNAALIPAAAPGSSAGHAYTWFDAAAQQNTMYWYRLEAVDLAGNTSKLGAIDVIQRSTAHGWLPLIVR